jgi:integrase
MQRSEPRRDGLSIEAEKAPRRKTNAWNQVFDERKRRARGLWERNGIFYAQINVNRDPIRFKLEHATTVPQAVTAQQVLKAQQRAGTLKRPADASVPEQVKAGTKTLDDAIQFYKEDREALKDKDPKTCERENSGLTKLSQYGGKRGLNTIDDKFRIAFAKWRRSTKAETETKSDNKKKKKEKQPVGGRTVDLDIIALGRVIDVCIREEWLIQSPFRVKWKKLAKKPEKVRLISTGELNHFCETAVKECPERGLVFADYLQVLSLTGGREKETLAIKWDDHVHWERRQFEFPGGKRGGGSQAAGEPRFIDFFPKLEKRLKDMYKRRDRKSSFLFPAKRNSLQHTKTFKQTWIKVRKKIGVFETEKDIGFHHTRHYFISHCVMAGIDFMTIAIWVGHRDGGAMIGRIYGHLKPGHAASQAAKLATAKAWN